MAADFRVFNWSGSLQRPEVFNVLVKRLQSGYHTVHVFLCLLNGFGLILLLIFYCLSLTLHDFNFILQAHNQRLFLLDLLFHQFDSFFLAGGLAQVIKQISKLLNLSFSLQLLFLTPFDLLLKSRQLRLVFLCFLLQF
jgi:hypothetical protein